LNSANAAQKNNPKIIWPTNLTPFNPGMGEHGDGTQYAPDGLYIWTNGKRPRSSAQYALPVEATADATGKVVFCETTVVNLFGAYQRFPVLSAFQIKAFSVKDSSGSKQP
jgi:hypothetical protein